MDTIRNFCIIAHIDHGKSTLADRLIQRCGGVEEREFRDQILDSMDIERERGITIKSNTVTLNYKAQDGNEYQLNLIDTPGHVDFSHEVRRSLMSCEGALLLIDAAQGVEAQTLANLYLALEYDLEVVPVINKIDLPSADIEKVREEIDEDLGLDPYDAVLCSAKQGTGIDDVLEAIVQKLPPPEGDPEAPLQALIFDAQYDAYRGVVMLCRVKEGTLRPGQTIRLMHSEKEYEVEEVGLLQLKQVKAHELAAGAVGYVIAGIKTVRDIAIGDTLTDAEQPQRFHEVEVTLACRDNAVACVWHTKDLAIDRVRVGKRQSRSLLRFEAFLNLWARKVGPAVVQPARRNLEVRDDELRVGRQFDRHR